LTAFTFNADIPASTNNPSTDQPKMLLNNQSELAIWGVDHITFNTAGSGTHEQTTFLNYATPATPANQGSVAYPAAGIEDAQTAEYFFKNAKATLPVSAVRSFGSFLTPAPSPTYPKQITPITAFNLTDIGANPTGIQETAGQTYTITLKDDVVFGNDIVVIPFIRSSTVSIVNFTFTNPVLTITISAGVGNLRIDFLILQI